MTTNKQTELLPCEKCGSTDLVVRYVERRQLINHSGRQRIETEFVTSDEYDFFWNYTAAKDHLSKHCRTCQHSWRENIAEKAQSAPEPVQGEAVAYLTVDDMGRCSLSIGRINKNSRPLYTAAAKPDAELVELLRECRGIVAKEVGRWNKVAAFLLEDGSVKSGLLARIDAKLAEVKL